MRSAVALVLVTGCRSVLGLEPPAQQVVDDAPRVDRDTAMPDGAPFAACGNDMNLVACFDFEDTVKDLAPSPNSVAGVNVAYSSGQRGKAALLDTASRIAIQDSVLLDVAAVSIEAWIYPTQTPSPAGRMGVIDVNGQYGMFLKPASAGAVLVCTAGSTFEAGGIAINQWTHVACTSANSVSIMYINGQVAAVATFPTPLETSPSDGGEVGGNSPDGLDRFIGKIDVLRVYRTKRTDAEICADAAACAQ
ncbi:MAG TPA: LamG domain-containing protein [Kofleriaceae bacterium]|nr:LamG domain-containing protein [Kofleriaceae bacterium]